MDGIMLIAGTRIALGAFALRVHLTSRLQILPILETRHNTLRKVTVDMNSPGYSIVTGIKYPNSPTGSIEKICQASNEISRKVGYF